ncbi:MAG TPA: glycosyltransferase family 1 protein, partial [Thermomicrobiaceae bacterium]|nr:glycosyltransferase family 1 protein [Thermomicrobiaceae bacterium]
VDERFRPRPTAVSEDMERQEQLDIRTPYILFLGTIQPRKNLIRLIAAFDRLAESYPDLRLILAGGAGWLSNPITEAVDRSPNRARIVMPGHVPDDLLPELYAGASAAVFPSLYEGFGLPAAEAMASGTPVVVSNRGALPEVVGEAGVLVDPLDIDSIAAGIRAALEPSTRGRRIEAGIEQAARFRWDTAASETIEVIHEAINSAGIDR